MMDKTILTASVLLSHEYPGGQIGSVNKQSMMSSSPVTDVHLETSFQLLFVSLSKSNTAFTVAVNWADQL